MLPAFVCPSPARTASRFAATLTAVHVTCSRHGAIRANIRLGALLYPQLLWRFWDHSSRSQTRIQWPVSCELLPRYLQSNAHPPAPLLQRTRFFLFQSPIDFVKRLSSSSNVNRKLLLTVVENLFCVLFCIDMFFKNQNRTGFFRTKSHG